MKIGCNIKAPDQSNFFFFFKDVTYSSEKNIQLPIYLYDPGDLENKSNVNKITLFIKVLQIKYLW